MSDNIDNWICSDNVDTNYNTCTAPDQYDLEIGQQPSSIDLNHTDPSSITPNDILATRSSRYFLRPDKRRDYKKLSGPAASKVLLQQALSRTTPLPVGTTLKDKIRHHWVDCIFATYDKMHTTCTLSCLFPTSYISKENLTILPSRLSFEVKITDVNNFYELKCRLCADESRMTKCIDFFKSYAPMSDADSFRTIIALAATKKYWLTFYDVSNAFQTNVIKEQSKRQYLRLPLYINYDSNNAGLPILCILHVTIGKKL